jgi:hypothetical protein
MLRLLRRFFRESPARPGAAPRPHTVRPGVEELEGKELPASGALGAPTLQELGKMAMHDAGKRASPPKIVYTLVVLLKEHVGFNLDNSLFGSKSPEPTGVPTPDDLESAFEAAWDAPPGPGRGFDCITLSSMAQLALQEVHVRGTLTVNRYIPDPGDPTKAIVGDLSKPPIRNPAHPNETEYLFDANGGLNNYEATLVYTYHGKTYYFPGGTALVYDNILTIFSSLGYSDDTAAVPVENVVIYSYGATAPPIGLR